MDYRPAVVFPFEPAKGVNEAVLKEASAKTGVDGEELALRLLNNVQDEFTAA